MVKVTVVIPAYNAMQYLPQTVNSVIEQTLSDWELLIINDGSRDHIIEWATTIQDSRVKLITQENQGVSAARNTGILQAKGEYIAFLDADDLWKPTKLEQQLQRFQEYPEAGLVYTWTALADSQGNPLNRILASNVEGDVWQQFLVANAMGNSSVPMVRRSCFDKVGLFDPSLPSAEDRDMWIRLAAEYPFAVVKQPLTLWLQHQDSMSKNRQKMLAGLRTVLEKNFATVPLELLYLRNQSYSYINMRQAWNSMDEQNLPEAKYFQQQAKLHHPPCCYSLDYLRLSLTILMMTWFGFATGNYFRKSTNYLYRLSLKFSMEMQTICTLLSKKKKLSPISRSFQKKSNSLLKIK